MLKNVLVQIFAVITIFSSIMGLLSPFLRFPSIPRPSDREKKILFYSFLISTLAGSLLLNASYWLKQSTLASSSIIVTDTAAPTSVIGNLEDDPSQWQLFYQKTAKATLQKVTNPSIDGTALKVTFIKGDPDALAHAYRNLAAVDGATTFELNLYFLFTSPTAVQNLYFSMDKWMDGQRWEWALQWQNFNVGTFQSGWYLWDGSSLQSIGVRQPLSANTWHFLHLYGDIFEGQVRYVTFTCDGISMNLGQVFAPIRQTEGDKFSVAVQLGDDSQGDPYQVYIDKVDLLWS